MKKGRKYIDNTLEELVESKIADILQKKGGGERKNENNKKEKKRETCPDAGRETLSHRKRRGAFFQARSWAS